MQVGQVSRAVARFASSEEDRAHQILPIISYLQLCQNDCPECVGDFPVFPAPTNTNV